MALDRLFSLYRFGYTDRNPVKVWATPTERSAIVAAFDANVGTPVESVILRMRDRPDLSLDSVLLDEGGRIWLPSEIHHVGRNRFLDVAVTHYEGAPITITPTLPVTQNYMPQAGYTVTKDGAAVQNFVIAQLVNLSRDGAFFRLHNDGGAGVVPQARVQRDAPNECQPCAADVTYQVVLKVRIGGDASNTQRNLVLGEPYSRDRVLSLFIAYNETITAGDTVFPAPPRVARLLGEDVSDLLLVGGYIRILSSDEVTG